MIHARDVTYLLDMGGDASANREEFLGRSSSLRCGRCAWTRLRYRAQSMPEPTKNGHTSPLDRPPSLQGAMTEPVA